MNEEEYFEQLCSNSVDGTLTDSEREKLETHLAECPSCAALKRDLEEMRALWGEEVEVPDDLHEGIMDALRQENKLHVVQPEKPVRRMPVFTMVGVAAAVVLVVLGGGLMPSFSTVGSGGSDSTAAGESPAVFADSYTAQADAPSDSTENEIAEAAEDAGILAAGGSTANTAPATNDIAPGGTPSSEAVPQTGDSSAPAVTSLPEGTDSGSIAAQSEPGGRAAVNSSDSSDSTATARTGAALTLPEAAHGLRVAHCYIAEGGSLPELGGTLLYSDSDAAWFLLDNNMTVLQDTLSALEKAGCTVAAYEDIGLTIDSKADSWLLIVRN